MLKHLLLISIFLFISIIASGQNQIFWTEGNLQQFYKINDDGSGKQLLLEDILSNPDDIVFLDVLTDCATRWCCRDILIPV